MKKLPYIYILLAGVFWGTIGLFLTTLLDLGFTRIQAAVIRMSVAAVGLAAYIIIKDRTLFKFKLRDSWCFIGTGLISVLLMSICYFYAIESTSLSVAAVLLYTSPIFVTMLSALLFKETLTAKKLAALPITVLGCALVTGLIGSGAQGISTKGLLAGIGSAITYALYSIFGRYALSKGYSSITVSFYTFLLSAIGLLPLMLLSSQPIPPLGTKAILAALGIGIISCLLPFLFYTKGLSQVENSKAAIIVTVEPLTATIIGAVAFSEPFTIYKVAGMALIFTSIALLSFNKTHSEG